MAFSAKTLQKQMLLLRPIVENMSLSSVRRWQDRIGEMMTAMQRRALVVHDHAFADFSGAWVIPKDERRQGVLLYLHGGGYTCGSLDYAKGVSATLAVECGVRVFCAAYRLAPEHPFPAALEDAEVAYRYLLEKGYPESHITLVGESAGGGLCYALCRRLQNAGMPMPAGIIGISPWVDLTQDAPSHKENRDKDVSLTAEMLDFFANSYTADRKDPYASPLFGDLSGMPPSLLFAGANELLRSDAERLYEKLTAAGAKAELSVAPDRWHAYVVYNLKENRADFVAINRFLSRVMSPENKLRWMRLDNAAKIYPAARRQNWSNVFRMSATLSEEVDAAVLQSAVDVTVRRFPSMAARLRRGVFWYYLEQIATAPAVREDASYPLVRMSKKETSTCAFRVLIWNRRIAVEFFHSLTDGTGALIFLKTLLAEYISQRYGVSVPAKDGVLGRLEEPNEREIEDSFLKYSGTVNASRREHTAWKLRGTPEPAGFLHVTCLKFSAKALLEGAHARGVSATVFLAAAMMMAIQKWQTEKVQKRSRRRPIKVLLPVNLRRLFPSETLRNFALYTTPEIEPRLGEYGFDEICKIISHHMGLTVTQKQMEKMIAANVSSERLFLVKIMPLFIKNFVMRVIFDAFGECKSCLSLSNLGLVQLPEEMRPYVEHFDFILGVQARAPHNCGVITYSDEVRVNITRDIRESTLEAKFHEVLRDLGIAVEVESN